MRVLLINEVFGTTSTGKICAQIAEQMEAEGHEVKVAFGRWPDVPEKYQRFAHYIGSDFEVKLHAIQTRLFDTHGFGSKGATREFLKWAEEYKPNLLWLHNLHGYYINVEMLFDWIKKHPEMQVKWTLHDCWAFTGHCSHFSFVQCDEWKIRCENCSQMRSYPSCYLRGNVGKNYDRKHNAFTGVPNMTLVTPSKWLAELTRQSFLKEYSVEVHYNTIDLGIFKPTASDFRERLRATDKLIVLGVANVWNNRKGLDDFYELARMLNSQALIVLVGLTKKQMKSLLPNMRGFERTNSPQELAELYTTADVFVNPTYEDNYPTVNLEAQACGTPVIAYDAGGTKETLNLKESRVVPVGEIEELYQGVMKMRDNKFKHMGGVLLLLGNYYHTINVSHRDKGKAVAA